MPNQTHRAPPRYKIPGFFSILLVLPAVARTSVNIRWPPSLLARGFLAAAVLDRIVLLQPIVVQLQFPTLTSLFHEKCDLLKARVVIYAYQHQ